VKIKTTPIQGVLVLESELVFDERGSFARTWDRAELEARGLTAELSQLSVAFNETAGTLRGLHYQVPPHAEAKTIACTVGSVFDVVADLRPGSPSLYTWFGIELTAGRGTLLYIPEGCAHGYVTLADRTEVSYGISVPYRPEAARGYRWDDPTLAIAWPIAVRRISARDAALPFIDEARASSA
jgi:dTDP-4-dehydrorhamnose 3,5-epimerase